MQNRCRALFLFSSPSSFGIRLVFFVFSFLPCFLYFLRLHPNMHRFLPQKFFTLVIVLLAPFIYLGRRGPPTRKFVGNFPLVPLCHRPVKDCFKAICILIHNGIKGHDSILKVKHKYNTAHYLLYMNKLAFRKVYDDLQWLTFWSQYVLVGPD